jgi:hypothetical protein
MNFLFPITLNRKQYALRLLTFIILLLAFILLSSLIELSVGLLLSKHLKGLGTPALLSLLLLKVAPIFLGLCKIPCLDMPRLRSIGWSPWLVLLFLIPFVNLILLICLFSIAPTVDYTDDRQEGQRSPEVRALFWSASIFVLLVIASGTFVMYFKFHPVNHRGIFAHSQASQSDTAQTEAGQGPLKLADSNLQVDSIFYLNSSRSSAVVNGNSVMVDDRVGKWVLTAISSNSVSFRNADGDTSIVRVK